MIADLAGRIGGERIRVVALMGPGIDPHLYRASAGDVRRLADAELILFSGLHLEAAMGDVLEGMSRRRPVVAVSDGIPRGRLLAAEGSVDQFDPHIWFDVDLWAETVPIVVSALAELDPEGAEHYRSGGVRVADSLRALDRWVRDTIAVLPTERRVLVTAHDAFHYFGRAYGMEVRGLQGISTVAEVGASEVQRLASLLVDRGIPALFLESSVPRRNVDAVLAAVSARGGRVRLGGELFSDAMGDPGTPEGTFEGMVRHNVRTIVGALSHEPEEGR